MNVSVNKIMPVDEVVGACERICGNSPHLQFPLRAIASLPCEN